MSTLITIASFANAIDANLAKGLLESAGIDAFIPNENINMMYGQLLGDMQLQVFEQDVLAAKQVLAL